MGSMANARLNNEIKSDEIDKEIYQIEPHVFVSESRAQSGETIYLRMELITEKNKPYIDEYIRQVNSAWVTGNARCGILTYMTHYIEPIGSDNYAFTAEASHLSWNVETRSMWCPLDDIKEFSGYSDEELKDFIQWMGKNGFHSKNEKRADLHDTAGGSAFLHTSVGDYFVYACKEASFFIHKTTILPNEISTLKRFVSQYKDMLICVGSTYSDEHSVSRGIFRNPMTSIDKTYQGIAIALIGFSGAVAHRFLNKKTMYVGPIGRMPGILCAALKKNEFTVSGMSDAAVRKKAERKSAFFDFNGFTIQLTALNRIFNESQRTEAEIAEDRQKTLQNDKRYHFFKAAGYVAGFSLMAFSAYVCAKEDGINKLFKL